MSKKLVLEANENLLTTLKCYRDVSAKQFVLSLVTNFILTPLPSEVANGYILTLTDSNLYVENIYQPPLGNDIEVISCTKIPLTDIENLTIKEHKDKTEISLKIDGKDEKFFSDSKDRTDKIEIIKNKIA